MDILDEAAAVADRESERREREAVHDLIATGLHAWPELETGYTSYMEAYHAGMWGPAEERQEWRERAARIWETWREKARELGLI